jgi:hypothetical protein
MTGYAIFDVMFFFWTIGRDPMNLSSCILCVPMPRLNGRSSARSHVLDYNSGGITNYSMPFRQTN